MYRRHSFDRKVTRNPLVKTLIREVWALGYSVRFVPSWRNLRVYNAYGMHERSMTTRVIWCARYRLDGSPRTVGEIAFILAHELRHAQHMRDGLYDAYYDRDDLATMDKLGISVAVGYRAELDCDRYAVQRCKEAGVYTPLMHRTYPRWKVCGYLEYRRVLLARQFLREAREGEVAESTKRQLARICRLIQRNKSWKTEKFYVKS